MSYNTVTHMNSDWQCCLGYK